MKLSKSIDKALLMLITAGLVLIFGMVMELKPRDTFAEGEEATNAVSDEHFVNFYDNGEKLTVRTTAKTVGEAIERAEITLGTGDIIEPALEEEIDSDNFFINIYRARPVIVRDGVTEKYIMTASYDARMIAWWGGFTIYDEDEVKLVRNTNFLETGAVEVYEIVRHKVVAEAEETEAEVEAESEPVISVESLAAMRVGDRPLTAAMGRNRYTLTRADGTTVGRQETYYDLNMNGVMAIAARECGVENYYTVREDGVKIDADGYVLVAANLNYYPRCTVVETSLGMGKVYDTGGFAEVNPEQFDIATDWSWRDGI